MNTASRMETSSEPNRINLSRAAYDELLLEKSSLQVEPRGLIELKGKGGCRRKQKVGEQGVQNDLFSRPPGPTEAFFLVPASGTATGLAEMTQVGEV